MIIQLVVQQNFGIDDIVRKVEDVKESNYRNRFDAIKKDRQVVKEQDIERYE